MAIKVSNQITFTEHKKIVEIKEWYLVTPEDKNVTNKTEGWSTDIPTMDSVNKYLWNYEEVVYSLGSSDITDPVIIGVYGEVGTSLQVKYISSATTPIIINNDVSAWSDTIPAPRDGHNVYMTQKLSNQDNWSTPIQISGSTTTTEIIDGYWYINGEPTGVKAEGNTPEITIGEDGYWYIDGKPTQTKAQGDAGQDGASIEYVYYLSETEKELQAPYYENDKLMPSGWTASPLGITTTYRYEYVSVRIKSGGMWSNFSQPAIWSAWGEKGQDGDGVAYEYYLCNESDVSKIPAWSESDANWKDDPQGVSAEYPYEYVVQLSIKTEADGTKKVTASAPSLWAKYGETGASLQIKYINSETVPTIIGNNVSKWLDYVPAPEQGKNTYMTQKLSTEINWSAPIQISAMDGAMPKVEIVNGYWYVNGESTDVKAEGSDGDTPEITIGSNGNWFVNGVDSGNKAEGPAGQDGASIEYVYYRSANAISSLSRPSYVNGVLTSGWTASPMGITLTYQYEYVSVRTKPVGEEWGQFSKPVIWSKWGEKGQDGDGIEYRYYLSNSATAPKYVEDDPKWTDDPSGVSVDNQYEYVVQIKLSNGKTTVSEPALWAKYGASGSSLQIKYKNSATVPTIVNNNVSTWSDTVPAPEAGKKTYMTQKLSTDTKWSTPIQISGVDGKDGSADITINSSGYWVINGEVTTVKAQGSDGNTPKVEIKNGYWYINDVNSNIKAEGAAGRDGADIEFVYYRGGSTKPYTPYYSGSTLYPTGWKASPQGVTANTNEQYEYVSVRRKASGTGTAWGSFSTPVIWSKWGEKGQDGDGIEYKYYRSNSSTVPTYSASNANWTDDPKGVTSAYQYEYVVQFKTVDGVTTQSKVALWAKYGANGSDGKGIVSITNYYATTTSVDVTPSGWKTSVPELTPTNKYLWNYEYILYTDNTYTTTTAAIIGVYGDSGTDAVDFQIYSVDGFEFGDDIKSITLQTIAFQGGQKISSGATYRWKWWNPNSTATDKYETITNQTTSSLTVNSTDTYAFATIKCEMTYGGITYEDYVRLTEETTVYTATVKFFNGNNVISTGDDYVIAYVELYKNNIPEELLQSDEVYVSSSTTVSSAGVITSTITNSNYSNGSLVYFVYKKSSEYDVVLGQYSSNCWTVVSSGSYVYKNSLFTTATSPVIYIPKGKISKALNINCEVLKGDAVIARTSAMVMDLNDPIVSSTQPSNPQKGQLWLDTSVSPSLLKMYDGSKWVNSGYQSGNVVYTSQPTNGYTKGDLWILAEGEVCENTKGKFEAGSLLKANTTSSTFNASHWEDAMGDNTAALNNIKQYFMFNAQTGLRIGQLNEEFYVNISSEEMGFYDAQYGTAKKVVSISNKAALIQDLTVKEGAKFDCEVEFGSFIWKTESNGGLSLIYGK